MRKTDLQREYESEPFLRQLAIELADLNTRLQESGHAPNVIMEKLRQYAKDAHRLANAQVKAREQQGIHINLFRNPDCELSEYRGARPNNKGPRTQEVTP